MNFYRALSPLSLKCSDWPVCNSGITQFYLPPTHKPHLPLLLSRLGSKGSTQYRYVRINIALTENDGCPHGLQ